MESIAFISDETVFAHCSLGKRIEPIKSQVVLVFSFGLNKSQKIEVEKAMTNKITVIQGPTRTGKTQTILNFIANVVHQKMKTK